MTAATLLSGLAEAPDIAISGITSDTGDVGEGVLFLACRGQRSHGLDYAEQAIAAVIEDVRCRAGMLIDSSPA